MRSFRVLAPHFAAGGEVDDNERVVRTAPIIKYMLKWPIERVRLYCRTKRWSLEYGGNRQHRPRWAAEE